MTKEIVMFSLLALLLTVAIILLMNREKFSFEPAQSNPTDLDVDHATYTQAYLQPTKMLELPPLKHLSSASHQATNEIGIPKSMFKGSEKVNMNFTSDMLWCK